jgi:hypothetical protein
MKNGTETVIELRELRIGNLLTYKGKLVYVTSLSLDVDDESEDTIGFCEYGKARNEHAEWNRALYNDLKRIPITPEWLGRYGFRQFANGAYHKDAMLTWRVWYDDY